MFNKQQFPEKKKHQILLTVPLQHIQPKFSINDGNLITKLKITV